MRVVYTKHAAGKFESLRELGIKIRKTDIRNAIKNPDYHGEYIYRGTEFVLKQMNDIYNLRVIFAHEDDIIIVITFHPTKKGRYVK